MNQSFFFFLILSSLILFGCSVSSEEIKKPNILILHADQWRAQAFGYAGDPNVKTPHIDRLAGESANLRLAVSGMPVCCPHRASLQTGQRPLTHGVFMNDVQLDTNAVTIAEVLAKQGYQTGYIGKWHLDGRGRSNFTPPGGRRQGYQYWKALECSHNYNQSAFYFGQNSAKQFWNGYDAIAQTRDAQRFIRENTEGERPFFLMLSWGTPHAPYHTAPDSYRKLYHPDSIQLPPNVPESRQKQAQKDLAGYYAHATALDDMLHDIRETLTELNQEENTIILFTSDHGDLLGSHDAYKKQQPYEESIRVPMLFYTGNKDLIKSGVYNALFNTEDIMPTLLGMCGIPIPTTVEGYDYSAYLNGASNPADTATIITCVQPFGQWNRIRHGGKEYRGLRTTRFTYTRDLNGPWLLFDNQIDPYQLHNLIGDPVYTSIQTRLDVLLNEKLQATQDDFLPGLTYVKQYGYPPLNETQTVPYER